MEYLTLRWLGIKIWNIAINSQCERPQALTCRLKESPRVCLSEQINQSLIVQRLDLKKVTNRAADQVVRRVDWLM